MDFLFYLFNFLLRTSVFSILFVCACVCACVRVSVCARERCLFLFDVFVVAIMIPFFF